LRLAPLALLAACSSPASTSTTTHPGDDVYVTIDAAPAVAEAPPDAAAGPCLSAKAGLVSLASTTIQACTDWFEDVPKDCYEVTADGAVKAGPPVEDAIVERAASASFDDFEVEACVGETCKSFRPSVGKTLHVVAASTSPGGATVVVLHNGQRGPAMLELWDFETGKRTARAEYKIGSAISYEAEFLAGVVLVTATTDSDDEYVGSLWSASGSKLTMLAELEGSLGAAVALDDDRGVFLLDERVAVVDLTSGAAVIDVDWRALVEGDPGEDVDLSLAADAGRFAIAVAATERGPLLALAVGGTDGKPRRYPVAICPA
jgi:hypothetical protein